ncbi:AsnC family transcriptional regulator [Streptomyces sp. NPDC001941]|uniref:AsnC family transcriptional regulator n=1 Tax=Streptomyces sp. NPDC001941 TaxID=3154659 RepID=UPI003322D95F
MLRESVTLDAVDRGLLRALYVDGRAPFARIAGVLGVSDRTLARRYARLRALGLVRVVGVVDARRLGGAEWLVRVSCAPGAAAEVARALARREDTRWVNLLSGGTELCAGLRSWTARERDELLLDRLQRTAPVLALGAHEVLHVFTRGNDQGMYGADELTAPQLARITPVFRNAVGATALDDADRPLLRALAEDGRAPGPVLAAATGWSPSRVARRVEALRAAGILGFDVDLDTRLLGRATTAYLWASVPPARLAETGEAVAGHPEVTFCAATTGATNLMVVAVFRDGDDLYRYLTRRLAELPGIDHVETAPVIRAFKRATPSPSRP